MDHYTNEMTFVLFPNDKGNNPKRPDWRGKVFIGGEEYKLSGWFKVSGDGKALQYIKGPVEKIDPNAPQGYTAQPPVQPRLFQPRDIPPPTYPAPVGATRDDKSEDVPF